MFNYEPDPESRPKARQVIAVLLTIAGFVCCLRILVYQLQHPDKTETRVFIDMLPVGFLGFMLMLIGGIIYSNSQE